MLYEHFKNGINIGGWLSQYDCLPKPPTTKEEIENHFQTYMTEENFAQIASWGMDHVRLPVDYRVLEKENDPMIMNEKAFYYMDLCADWCEKNKLNLVIDLHNVEGNVYGAMAEPMPLLVEEKLQERFLNIWSNIAKHFKERNNPIIMFELLNEVSDGSGYLWNTLCKKTVKMIREIDEKRWILLGSNEQNSAFRLKELTLFEDAYVFYNFHFYDPQVFTHQKAHFSDEMKEYNQTINYPGDISDFQKYLQTHRDYLQKHNRSATEIYVDKNVTAKLLKDAFDFVKYSNKELYCGEFGVIDSAQVKDRAAWTKDCMELFESHKIGHALWNYKEMDFGLINCKNEVVSEELIKEITSNIVNKNN